MSSELASSRARISIIAEILVSHLGREPYDRENFGKYLTLLIQHCSVLNVRQYPPNPLKLIRRLMSIGGSLIKRNDRVPIEHFRCIRPSLRDGGREASTMRMSRCHIPRRFRSSAQRSIDSAAARLPSQRRGDVRRQGRRQVCQCDVSISEVLSDTYIGVDASWMMQKYLSITKVIYARVNAPALCASLFNDWITSKRTTFRVRGVRQ